MQTKKGTSQPGKGASLEIVSREVGTVPDVRVAVSFAFNSLLFSLASSKSNG